MTMVLHNLTNTSGSAVRELRHNDTVVLSTMMGLLHNASNTITLSVLDLRHNVTAGALMNGSVTPSPTRSSVISDGGADHQVALNSLTHQVSVGIVLALLDLLMMLGNVLALITISRSPSLHCQPKYLLIANLAFADFLWSILLMPPAIVWEIHGTWMFGKTFCDLYNVTDISLFTVSTYSLLLITIDKYIYICRPLTYPSVVKTYRVVIMIVLVWGLWITYGFVSVFAHLYKDPDIDHTDLEDPCHFVMNKPYAVVSGIISFYAPFFTLSVLSIRIIYITHNHIKKINRVSIPQITVTQFYDNKENNIDAKNIYSLRTIPKYNKGSPLHKSRKIHQQYHACDHNCPNVLDKALNNKKLESNSDQENANSESLKQNGIKRSPKKDGIKNPLAYLQERCSTWRGVALLLSVVITFTVMVSPYWIATTINVFCDCVPVDLYDDYLVYFYYMNPLVNPYIYMVTDRLYRTTMVATLRKLCHCPKTRKLDTNVTNTTMYNETFNMRNSQQDIASISSTVL